MSGQRTGIAGSLTGGTLDGRAQQVMRVISARNYPRLADTSLRQFGRLVLYLCVAGAVAVLGLLGRDMVVVSLMLGMYMAFIAAARKPLWARTPWPLPQPVLILSVWWLFSYGIFSLPKFLGTYDLHWDLIGHESYLYLALLTVIASNVLVVAGYMLTWPGAPPDVRKSGILLQGSLSLLIVVGFWVLSLAARAYLFGIGRFGYVADFSRAESGFRQTATFVYEFSWLAIAALVVEYLTIQDSAKKLRIALLLCAISVVELVSVVAMGFKGYAILTFGPAIAALWGMRRRLLLKFVGAGALIILLIAPGNYAYREDVNTGKVQRGDFLSVAETSLVYTVRHFTDDPIESLVLVWDSATREFADNLENIALILYKTPSQVPHRGADWYFTAVPRAIFPRFVWKDKPIDDMASYMTVVYRGVAATSGSPPGYAGELYMRAGAGGVVLGSLFTGLLLGLLTRIFARGSKKAYFVAYCGVVAATISNTHLDSLIVYSVQRGVLYTAAAWLMFLPVRGKGELSIR